MPEIEGSSSPEIDLTTAGPMTLGRLGVSFAVGGEGEVLRYPDGMPINGDEIERIVLSSGQALTNEQAAKQIIRSSEFTNSVKEKIAELRQDKQEK